jgi:hypothetical protein
MQAKSVIGSKSRAFLDTKNRQVLHILKQQLFRSRCCAAGFKFGATGFNNRDVLPCKIRIVTVGKGNSSGAEAMAGTVYSCYNAPKRASSEGLVLTRVPL